MITVLWCVMFAAAIIYAMISKKNTEIFFAIQGMQSAVDVTLKMLAGYAFFCGWMEVLQGLHAPEAMTRWMRKPLKFLFPQVKTQASLEGISLNFAANLLGLGNAATPSGLTAMRALAQESGGEVSDAMKMFLVVNATSLQLLPTTVIALRAASGSAAPTAIVLPTLVSTAVATAVGIACAKLCARKRHAKP